MLERGRDGSANMDSSIIVSTARLSARTVTVRVIWFRFLDAIATVTTISKELACLTIGA